MSVWWVLTPFLMIVAGLLIVALAGHAYDKQREDGE